MMDTFVAGLRRLGLLVAVPCLLAACATVPDGGDTGPPPEVTLPASTKVAEASTPPTPPAPGTTSVTSPAPTPPLASTPVPTVDKPAGDVASPSAVPVAPIVQGAASQAASTPSDAAEPALNIPPGEARDPLRPDVRIDLEDRSARLSLWDRMRAGFAMPDLQGDLVRRAERMYASQPDYVQRMNERGGRYLFHIVEEVQRRGLPTELALLPFVESAFNPEALSRARASGMWQFMPATGKVFKLTQNVFRDDRRDVLASTRAALDYLEKLHGMFGDWHLALAAYNWGEGNVQRAVRRQRQAGQRVDYASMRMPNETRFYVPKLQAIKNIVNRPSEFGLTLPVLENHPYFLAVAIDRDIDVDTAVRLAGIGLDDFKALNPQQNRPVILAAGTPHILLPYDHANAFVKALSRHRGNLATWTAWTVPTTMKSADAARTAGMSDEGFRAINHIPPRMLVKAGSTVLVPRNAKQSDVPTHVAEKGSLELAHESPPMRKVTVRVGRHGDTVPALAKRHGVTAAQVASWNGLSQTAKLVPGATVTLQLASKPVKGPRITQAQGKRGKSKATAIAQRPGSARR